MAFDASQILPQGKAFFAGLTQRQKILLAAAVVAVVGSLWLFVSLLGRGDYKVLYAGLDPAEASTIAKRLAQENVPAQLSADGKTLSVAESRLDKARLDMAAQGFPQSGRLGFEIFNKPNWGQSDFAEKVNYQRALEGELERTIQDLNDVEAVRVNLVLPHESLFTEQEREAKASVLVKLRGGHLSERSLKAITYLVASAVDTLRPENVTVVDADGSVPIVLRGGVKQGSMEGAVEYEQALDQKLTATLTPVLGADHFVARATVEYDPASTDNTQEIYDPKDTVVLTSQVMNNGGSGDTGDSGIPGAASNVPQAQANNSASTANTSNANTDGTTGDASSDSGDDEGSGSTSDSKTYAVGRTVVHTVRPPGAIRRISAAVLVDDLVETKTVNGHETQVHTARNAAQLKQIQSLAAAVLGLDPARGDVVTVENIAFHITPIPPAQPLIGLKRIGPLLSEYGYLLRYVILGLLGLLIYLFVFKPLLKQLGSTPPQMVHALPGGEPAPALAAAAGALPEAPLALPEGEKPAAVDTSPEGRERQRVKNLRDALTVKVAATPAQAGRLLEGWLREDESK
ncbi:MAG TPA: flagellar basal-body MS-ring/collar protein FliF [Terriglobia bacterium]|nr:flagellar basal-body MS-ring/collar protein FliF [Terriglobia bacterium]